VKRNGTRLDLPQERLSVVKGRPSRDRAASRICPSSRSCRRTCSHLRQVQRAKGEFVPSQNGQRRDLESIGRTRAARIAADCRSNASIAGYATPPAITVRGIPTISRPAALNRGGRSERRSRRANAARLQAVAAPAAPTPDTRTSHAGALSAETQSDRIDRGPQAPNHVGLLKGEEI